MNEFEYSKYMVSIRLGTKHYYVLMAFCGTLKNSHFNTLIVFSILVEQCIHALSLDAGSDLKGRFVVETYVNETKY